MNDKVKPLVTIAIPTYNRADAYLSEALESAVSQTYQNIEIIVSDNCSTDKTEMVVRGFSDAKIRYFRQEKNIGANNNFNCCIEQAGGSYVLLLHDDDLIDPDFVEVCMKTAGFSEDFGLIRTGMRRIDAVGNVLSENVNLSGGLSTADFFLDWFKGRTPMHLCMTLFNTRGLKQIGGVHSEYERFQDVISEVQLAAKFGRIDVKEVKASFRMHSDQHTHQSAITPWCEDSQILLDLMCDLVPDKKEMVRRKGKQFFLKHNYNIARKMQSPADRFASYKVIFKKFGWLYSLGNIALINALKNMRRTKTTVKLLREAVQGAGILRAL